MKKKKRLRFVLLLCAVLALVLNGALYAADNLPDSRELTMETEAHFIDVGQGDATLLLSGGQAILIDAGTTAGGGAVVRYLQELGVEQLTAVVATHPHADHIGGMAQVIDAFPIRHFYLGRETANTAAYRKMLDALEEQAVDVSVPTPGEKLPLESGAVLVFLGPADDVPDDDLNNRSLVTLFRAGGQDVLLMGDAEAPAERSLIAHYPSLSCDILKVGHHGSETSSSEEFLRAVHPSTAVISCGVDNDYGHPHEQALQRLSAAGVTGLHITAKAGDIVIPLDTLSENKENAA